jgi:3D (Asp-Asp-Asp) domain-containing protein
MGSLLLELGNNEIISAGIAVNLRNYIASRNPTLSPFMRAGIFADAVNRIVDSRIPGFSEGLSKRLKDNLFREIAAKPVFSIDCADVFKAAVKLKTLGYEFFREMSQWLSALMKKTVARESLFDLVVQAHRLMDERPGDDVSDILDSVEQNIGGLKYISYDFGENIKEYVRPQRRTYEDGTDEAALKRVGLLDIIKRSLLFTEPKRILVTSAFAAAVLSFMLFAGNITDAASNDSNPNILNSFPITGTSYSSALNMEVDTFAKSLSIVKTGEKRMRATAYDLSVESCGKRPGHPLYGITSSGARAIVGRTVAVDPSVIPLGSMMFISFPAEYSDLDGVYTAEDTGRLIKGDAIDIFFGEDLEGSREIYESAMEFGVRYVDVRLLD